ncbi:Glycosyl phosphatidyl inositol anchor synthesis [Arachnomyces sp. PD_36]|nr:Glycosyl phosphatidyl inositol anchor synthesis [Arachnomyces sp. PD_36]
MPPKRKAVAQLSGLIDSDGEDDIQMSGEDAHAAEPEEGPPAKKAKGRPKAAASTAPKKPARRKPRTTVTAPTRRTAAKRKPPVKQVVEETQADEEEEEGSEHGDINGTGIPETQHEQEEQDNISPDELDSPKNVQEPSPAKPQPKKTRGRAAKKVTVVDGFEYTPTGTRQIKPEEMQKAEGAAKRTGARGRKPTAKVQIQEAPPPEEEQVSEVEETTFPDEEEQAEQELPPSPSKQRINGHVGARPQSARRQRVGGPSDNEPTGGEPALRRKLGEMTKKYETLDAKYRNLREVGVVEANANFEKLRKQCDATTAASDELIASLKKELAAQSAIAQKSRTIQRQLQERDSEISKLKSKINDGSSGLAAAQNEVKTLQAKLAASRTAATESAATSKSTVGAAKTGINARNGAGNNAETAHAAQVAQLKEDLYSDLTGLIIRDVKKRESDHLYDCIQTGMNGTLHFKLAVAEEGVSESFESAEFHYMPLLDSNRDKDLIEVLPDYLTVDITFSRQQSAKWRESTTTPFTKMARLGRIGFLALAIVFHFVYIFSIFDIYFVSPIVSGMKSFGVDRGPKSEAPAKRLVLFVGDGLRADKAFQSFEDPTPALFPDDYADGSESIDLTPRPLAPFVRSRVLEHGTFGVSHTRVPTESRPGHVALIAGLYEDVSAVTTGWKLNPVNFDSVFNRSRQTWSWGSPDILPMFKEGAVPGRVYADTYGEEAEDFSQDATTLDTWVFDKVKEFFASAKDDPELNAQLREDKLVFFLHLLGLDTTGHSYRPYSKEYLHNIKVVDEGVEEITKLIEDFYGDDKTAFVFTADHGMSDWGSHGDGHPDNTRTPLVAWGSGVAKPNTTPDGLAPGHEDGFSLDWNLDHVQRHDVAQADVAALMSYLAGLDYPVNSVGQVPLSYIDGTPEEKALAALANVQGVLEMYNVKEDQKRSVTIGYKPYGLFGDEEHSPEHRVAEISTLITEGKYDESIAKSSELLVLALEGLRYLQTYDWLFLRTIVTIGYLGWIAYALTTVIDLHVLHSTSDSVRTTSSTIFFASLLVGLYSILWVQKSPLSYYAYGAFPVFFWEEVITRRQALIRGREALLGHVKSIGGFVSLGLKTLAFIGVLQALVQSYFHREIFTVCFLIAALWPIVYGSKFLSQNRLLVASWFIGCTLSSVFTLLPVIKIENADTITFGGALMFFTGVLYLIFEESLARQSTKASSAAAQSVKNASRVIMGVQLGMILLAVIVTRSSVASLQAKQGLPLGNQVVGWLVLMVIFLTFSPTFIILTISYEGLFYFVFCLTLLTWVRLEQSISAHIRPSSSSATGAQSKSTTSNGNATITQSNGSKTNPASAATQDSQPHRALTISDARIALFFLFLLQSAFFSTGNIASISSFSLESVTRLIPIFNPFSQGALLILKILIPFAIISANLGILNRMLGVAPSALFMVVMSISDVMTMNFFYMVRDEGSWLDIGTTISHFCIASLFCVFVAGLEFVSEAFISGVEVDTGVHSGKEGEKQRPDTEAKKNGAVDVSAGGDKKHG